MIINFYLNKNEKREDIDEILTNMILDEESM